MITERECPGLPADWLNAWLAAVGATVLVPGLRLRWTEGPRPIAVFALSGTTTVDEALAAALPNAESFDGFPLADSLEGYQPIKFGVTFEQFAERAIAARAHEMGWTLSSLYTDLTTDRGRPSCANAPFLPGMPAGRTADERLCSIAGAVGDVAPTLDGVAVRAQQAGLGFDITRIGSIGDKTDHWVDPVVELLAFFGLRLFPARSDGSIAVRQRNWMGRRVASRHFSWPAWRDLLDVDAIDALLDGFRASKRAPKLLGVHASWTSVSHETLSSSDVTRGFGSRRIVDGF